MGGDFGFLDLQYSMRRAAYGYLSFRSACKILASLGYTKTK